MTRQRGELPEPEEQLLGIERPTPEQEAEAERNRLEKLEVRRVFLLNLMQSDLFRAWLMETLVAYGTFENSFGAGPTGFPDPNATWFQAGMKAAGWNLWCVFDEVSPELASLMRRESVKGSRL